MYGDLHQFNLFINSPTMSFLWMISLGIAGYIPWDRSKKFMRYLSFECLDQLVIHVSGTTQSINLIQDLSRVSFLDIVRSIKDTGVSCLILRYRVMVIMSPVMSNHISHLQTYRNKYLGISSSRWSHEYNRVQMGVQDKTCTWWKFG